MAINISAFLGPTIIVLAGSLILLFIMIVVLSRINRKLKRDVVEKKQTVRKEEEIRDEIKKLKISNDHPKELLDKLNVVAKSFLSEAFKIKNNLDYSDMITVFKERKRYELVSFCEQITEILYSGEQPKKDMVKSLIESFEFIYNEEFPQLNSLSELEEKNYEVEKMADKLASIKEENIISTYRDMQDKFKETYERAEKSGNKEDLERLDKLRRIIIKRIEDYKRDKFRIVELSEEVQRGEKIIDLITSRSN